VNEQLLVVVVAEAIREELIDALIQYEEISGFGLQEISGYSREHSQYDLAEQVAGYRKLCRFEIQHRKDQEFDLLDMIREVCNASHARYWIVPIIHGGQLGQGS
jgi:hypothetical protein